MTVRVSVFRRLHWICILCAALCLLLAAPALAQEAQQVLISLDTQGGAVTLCPVTLEDGDWLFLPAFAQEDELSATVDGAAARLCISGGEGVVVHEGETEPCLTLNVMRSENLRAFFLFSDDPVQHGRSWLEDCPLHENFTTASLAMVDAAGGVNHVETITKLRGRGNGSWYDSVKKGYQIKLETRVDLLDTGDRDERSRTWLLLAEARDKTLLHNRVSLDLALELGLEQTSRSEFVDLYYDGEYCGVYLLCEKVQVGEGRVDVRDYDDLLETWNAQIGQYDLDALPDDYSFNQYGNLYTFIRNVADNEDPGAGGYLLELEHEYVTLSDRCWFRLSDHSAFAVKSPENASEPMMRYISERLEEAWQTLVHRGVNPQTGRTIEEEFNVDAFARTALLHELSSNIDGFIYSSSFFVLPEETKRFEPGPIWDFDLAYRNFRDKDITKKLKDDEGLLTDFYSVPAFRDAMQRILRDELYPLVQDVLLGTKEGRYLKPLDTYAAHLAAASRMNEKRWGFTQDFRLIYGDTPQEDLELMRAFLRDRIQWMYEEILSWSQTDPDRVDLWADATYTLLENTLRINVRPWSNVTVQDFTLEQLTEADEENYAVWQLDAVLAPMEGMAFENPAVTLNGAPLACEVQEDGTLRICATFEDLSYRPVDYYGEDIGLVYNYDDYIRRYPEVAEECDYDPELVRDYFVEEGMYEGQMGNAFFDPRTVNLFKPDLDDMLGDQWDMYYWEFLYYGYEDWMEPVDAEIAFFRPHFTDALGQ